VILPSSDRPSSEGPSSDGPSSDGPSSDWPSSDWPSSDGGSDGGTWFETVASRIAHAGHITVRIDTVATPDGATVEREVATPPDAVAVVALLDGDVVLVRQHRQPVGATLLELPAGVLDVKGEDVLAAAARELAEEVGLVASTMTALTTTWSSPGWSTERVTIVLATDVRPGPPPPGFVPYAEEAAMEIVRLPLAAAVAAAQDGTITDAKTIIGLLLAATRAA
jgi:8-oxo-dGTP pyrophosphatase MutT (NUDIX family)